MLYHIKNMAKSRQREGGYKLLVKSLRIAPADRIAITGPSGCGKSTTLDLLGLSLAPDSAEEFVFCPCQKEIAIIPLWQRGRLDQLADLRCQRLGYVLQSGELLPFLRIGENITLMARLKGIAQAEAAEAGRALAKTLGIEKLWNAYPATLSVGERQRAAICRALASRPDVIIADEPTAALDPLHAEKVMNVFLGCVRQFQSALILATHNAAWAAAGGLREIPFQIEATEAGAVAILDDGGAV